MVYCIDTSALLDGWVRYYPPDVFPSLWKNLEAMIEAGELIAPEDVLHELAKKEDDVHKWAESQDGLFHPLDEDVQRSTAEILAKFQPMVDSEKERNRADPFVVALARVKKCTVVTGEKNNGTPTRPKIPIVCDHFGIRCINILQLIREKRWKFG